MARKHSREFKLLLCRQIESKEISISQACRDHMLSMGLVERWLQQYRIKGDDSFEGTPWRSVILPDEFRVQELEQLLREVIRERNDLKKRLDREISSLQKQNAKLTKLLESAKKPKRKKSSMT